MADYFTFACNFSLTTVFFFCVFLKVAVLTEAVDNVMTPSLKSGFDMQSGLISFCLMAFVLSVVILIGIITLQRMIAAARVPIIRLVDTKASPKLTLKGQHKWHLFLSQCAFKPSSSPYMHMSACACACNVHVCLSVYSPSQHLGLGAGPVRHHQTAASRVRAWACRVLGWYVHTNLNAEPIGQHTKACY